MRGNRRWTKKAKVSGFVPEIRIIIHHLSRSSNLSEFYKRAMKQCISPKTWIKYTCLHISALSLKLSTNSCLQIVWITRPAAELSCLSCVIFCFFKHLQNVVQSIASNRFLRFLRVQGSPPKTICELLPPSNLDCSWFSSGLIF